MSGFQNSSLVTVGIIPNQVEEEMLILVDLNGVRQIEAKVTFAEIGLEPNRVYYAGFTSA